MRRTDTYSAKAETGYAGCGRAVQMSSDTLGLVVRELQHRMRNLLSVVLCFVDTTDADTASELRLALSARIAALSDAYRMIEGAQERRVLLAWLLERTLRPHAMSHRHCILLSGPDVRLEPHVALSLHVIFHELATNASKHGALSSAVGAVEISWDRPPHLTGQALAIEWRERGGPSVRKPGRVGFGTKLIERALPNAEVDLDFAPDGLVCRLLVDLDHAAAGRHEVG